MAQFGGDAYADYLISIALPILVESIGKPDAREVENVFATENAVSAITKILRFHANKVGDAQGLLQTWFKALPISNDEEEAPGAYEYLVQVLNEQPDAVLRGNDPEAIKHLVKVIVEALAICTFSEQLTKALVDVLQKTLGAFDDAAKAALWAEIPVEQQQALHSKGYF
ncbi:importin subunit beta-3 [Dipsacomyces acuminosporus]|nr:importin subunit beta-3 [Dipsacomyces acuminosporus]